MQWNGTKELNITVGVSQENETLSIESEKSAIKVPKRDKVIKIWGLNPIKGVPTDTKLNKQ